MAYINEKIAYLRGLCDGCGFDEKTKEGKIFNGIMDVLEELAEMADTLKEESINKAAVKTLNESALDEEPSYVYSFVCPDCGQEIDVEESVFDTEDEIKCPSCGNYIPVSPETGDLKF